MGTDLARHVSQVKQGAGPAVEQSAPQQDQQAPTLLEQIRSMQGEFNKALAVGGVEAEQLVRDAVTCVRTNPKLARAEPATVLGGLMTCAQLGLRPGVLGHAWLLPFRDKRSGRMQAQLVIGYQGYVDLAYRSGLVSSIDAHTIYESDSYHVQYGHDPQLIHTPDLSGTPGDPVAYYAVARLVNGGTVFRVMSHQAMLAHRDKYALSTNGPWSTDFESMAHKTCARQLAPWIPKSTGFAAAMSVDGTVRTDLSAEPAASGSRPVEADQAAVDAEIVDEPSPADDPSEG